MSDARLCEDSVDGTTSILWSTIRSCTARLLLRKDRKTADLDISGSWTALICIAQVNEYECYSIALGQFNIIYG